MSALARTRELTQALHLCIADHAAYDSARALACDAYVSLREEVQRIDPDFYRDVVCV